MCGRYTLTTTAEELIEEFDLLDAERIQPRFNIAPTQSAPVVRATASGDSRQLDSLRWGFIPHWAKDPSIGSRMINARSEEAHAKPSFRTSLRRQRCLAPCTGFYEWKKLEGGTRSRPRKQPYYIHGRDGRVFALAGIWDRWRSPGGETIESYAILTTEPNECLRPLHNRMPVIVDPSDYGLWLDPAVQDADSLKRLFQPYPDDALEAYAVGTQVNSPAFDDPACIEAIA
jgi:putative SOS response-associated peptidase YedK